MPLPPVRPDSFDKVNFVIDAWTTGCDAPWYIYVETMKPALLNAFITLITFGWDDVLRGFFRPKGLYKRRTAKRKGKRGHRIPHFPEIGNMLGKNLGTMAGVQGSKWTTLGRTLWRIDGAMEMVRFYWLVAAIAEDFAFEWTSLLYESYWCQDDALGRFSYQSPGYYPLPDWEWKRAGFGIEDYEQAPPGWGFMSGGTGSVTAVVTASLRIKKHPAYPPPTSVRVAILELGTGRILADSGTNDDLVDGEGAGVASGTFPPGTAFEVVIHMEGTEWALFGEGVVMGFEVPQ